MHFWWWDKLGQWWFLHLAQYQPKTGYPLWAKKTEYYADKGVVFNADLVILATQSTKRLAFFHSCPPTHVIAEVRRARMQFTTFTEWPQQLIMTSPGNPNVISEDEKDKLSWLYYAIDCSVQSWTLNVSSRPSCSVLLQLHLHVIYEFYSKNQISWDLTPGSP